MSCKETLARALALLALASAGCSREVVPERVRARVAYDDFAPTGTWVRTEPDGSTSSLTFTPPTGRNQLFGVQFASASGQLEGEALVAGNEVFATRHTFAQANDLCIYLYDRRGTDTLEAIWGSARAVAPIAYEEAHLARAREGAWNGVYSEWGNNMGGRYHDRLIIGRSVDGDPRLHRLHWTQGDHGWYRGMAFEFGDRLVGVRLPGVLVHETTWTAGSFIVTERSTEVGRRGYWVLGAYRLDGDSLVGLEASAGDGTLVQTRWTRPSAGGEVQPVQAVAAPAPPPEAPAAGDAAPVPPPNAPAPEAAPPAPEAAPSAQP